MTEYQRTRAALVKMRRVAEELREKKRAETRANK